MRIRQRLSALALVMSVTLTACSSGPTTREEVCSTFDALGTQLLQGNGVFGNPLFRKVDELADVAGRYEGEPDLSNDAERLAEIAESDATNGLELMNATSSIAGLCGHPLGTNAILGG